MDHGSHGGGGMGGHGAPSPTPSGAPPAPTCKISMLWNWHTTNSCFIARSWHNKSVSMFVGSCIGIFFFVLLLELVRRLQREYDRRIVARLSTPTPACANPPSARESMTSDGKGGGATAAAAVVGSSIMALSEGFLGRGKAGPTMAQQAVRAAIYMVQFGMAYFVMLLAMYYNGYVIICILAGAFVGHFLFGGDNLIVTGRQETGTSCC